MLLTAISCNIERPRSEVEKMIIIFMEVIIYNKFWWKIFLGTYKKSDE